uniref:Uncharacterized protein n=1 Tax=Plectus sambesii TaxID=2011161 RepID=A0A914UQV8_9BILA
MRSINPSITIQQAVGSAAVATAVGFALHHPKSPFAQRRRELGRREETSTEVGCHVLSTAAMGYVIITEATAGLFPLTAPRDPIVIGLGLAALTTVLDLPNILAEDRNLELFALNRLHDAVVITTVAGIIKQFLV